MNPRPECWHRNPVALVTFETRQQAGAHERGLAGAGGAKQCDEARPALGAPGVQALDQAANVVVATEVDRGVILIEGEQAWKGRPRRLPRELALCIERDASELGAEPLESAFTV